MVGASPSHRTLAKFSLCKNNKEFKLEEIVKNYEDLKTITTVKQSNRNLLEATRSQQSFDGVNQMSRTSMYVSADHRTLQPNAKNEIALESN